MLATQAAFGDGASLNVISVGAGEQFGVLRRNGDRQVMVLINLDTQSPTRAGWGDELFPTSGCVDLLSGEEFTGGGVDLGPGQVRCLSPESADLEAVEAHLEMRFAEPGKRRSQRVAALAADLRRWFGGEGDDALCCDPERFCAEAAGLDFCPMVKWDWERDARRVVVVAKGWGIIVRCPERFHVLIARDEQVVSKVESLSEAGRGEFALWLRTSPQAPRT